LLLKQITQDSASFHTPKNDDDVVVAVMTWFQALHQDLFSNGFNALVSYWDKCLNTGGDYVEK
jgi:hypothetical protein